MGTDKHQSLKLAFLDSLFLTSYGSHFKWLPDCTPLHNATLVHCNRLITKKNNKKKKKKKKKKKNSALVLDCRSRSPWFGCKKHFSGLFMCA